VTDFYDPLKLLRQLKGAPLACFLAFAWTKQRLTAEYLATITGYTDKPVTQALKLLAAYGWIVKVQGGWQIAAGVQLPLMSGESEKIRPSSSSLNQGSSENYSEEEQENRNNSDSFHANYRVMKANGIREPALSRLAALEHVTPAFILAHIKQVRSEHGHLGTAIHRIEKGWDPVEVIEPSVEAKRYTDGEFASFLRGD
jgi:hypothetical protein